MEPEFLVVLVQLREDRDIFVRFGAVLGQDVESKDDEQDLMDENPVVVRHACTHVRTHNLPPPPHPTPL